MKGKKCFVGAGDDDDDDDNAVVFVFIHFSKKNIMIRKALFVQAQE